MALPIRWPIALLFASLASSKARTQTPKTDSTQTQELESVVVSASRKTENKLQAPVSIEKLSGKAIRSNAQPSFFDAIETVKGVQMITPSLGFKVINARGFTNTTNVRFVQMVDGADIQAPHIGAPMGNALGPSDLDIASVEIVPGSASALYGMNAINGTANFITKDAFHSQGLSFSQKTGVNHVGDKERGAAVYSESTLRWAKAFTPKFAVKLNVTYADGIDWYANNMTDLNPNANISTGLTGNANPGQDKVNNYADESGNRRTIMLNGRQYVVSRTGYAEKDMASYRLQNLKGDVTLAYRIKPDIMLSYTFRMAQSNTIYQRTNRFRLDNYITSQHSLTLKTNSLQAKLYVNTENTGNSYNIRSMAENIDRSYKSDNTWFNDFSSQFTSATSNGATVTAAMQEARNYADNGRPVPHSDKANQLISQLRDINNWDIGAALRVKSTMYHAEMQHTLTDDVLKELYNRHKLSLMYGLDYREYVVVPDGNYFINPVKAGANLTYWKVGGFVQATQYLLQQRLKINAVLRVDKNQYYSAKLNPRIAVVYSPVPQHNFRLAVQQGYRFPSLFEAFSNINSGGVKRVGGLPVMSNGIFENSYLRASIDAFQAANTNDVNNNGLTINQAMEKNQGLLRRNNYTYLKPEEVKGIEAGYRTELLDGKLTLDVDFYFNRYSNLMAQVEANIPRNTTPDSLLYYLNNRQGQDRYRLWTNSKTISNNYGGTLGATWQLPHTYKLGGNVTLAKLARTSQNDGLEDGFNTPSWIYNINFGNPALTSHVGFELNYRWQSSYLWQSSLATGQVAAYHTLDAQVQYHTTANKLTVKLGATNLLNQYYYSFIGGPSIGGFYYTTITIAM
ncbi:iron complex outermembrane recepter protein [Filimonas lacunae]|uniref:Iron complex outermembrane recepter protein n=1 Tax=Filimonas lacunae TaxID=477680 RepID=A0A173MHS3_9BACT|nr:TonB-dependent receptor [Filimonas lacunae]BAV07040.1 TonB-dependent receptor [Filimonas lacunae]SIS95871.1 iron complex outermembrane recepter protein [Filimonas lacunae]